MKKNVNFTERANLRHNFKYDYSLTKYVSMKQNVDIICEEHGIFNQCAANHINGAGCPSCANAARASRHRKTKDEFLKECAAVHGDRYDYSHMHWKDGKTKINILCKLHGEFMQSPNDHTFSKAGCPACANIVRGNRLRHVPEHFVHTANIVHNNKYDYSLIEYKNVNNKLKIICPDHGVFEQVAYDHMNGHGCKLCADHAMILKNTLSSDEYIKRARLVHGEYYDYSLVQYVSIHTNIDIVCPEHGKFNISPAYHLRGAECPICVISTRSVESKWLDYCKVPLSSENRQVRIIINGKLYRVDGFVPETNTVYEFYGDYWHGNPAVFDPNNLNKVNKKTFGELYEATINRRNAIISAGYNIVEIWEADWHAINSTKH